MRIKINFITKKEVSIPFDYNYNIYLSLRKILFEYLKKNKPKYLSKYKNNFPNFTFSQLMIPNRVIQPGFIKINSSYFSLFVSSVDDTFMEYLVKSLYSSKKFPIFTNSFEIRKIEIIESPVFSNSMKFKMLSPMFLAKKEGDKIVFLRAEDDSLNEYFTKELINSAKKYFKNDLTSNSIKLTVDQNYLEQKKKTSRFFTIRNINYKTILAPIYLEGDIELIKFAYENGIGSKTFYGFGMIEPV
jgi:CRISPR-associated endoribonuclease Cas6